MKTDNLFNARLLKEFETLYDMWEEVFDRLETDYHNERSDQAA